MKINVYSEFSPLKHVLVHAPGPEVDEMPPSLMEDLLFDDVLFGDKARTEHKYFCRIMEMLGAEVSDVKDLLMDALQEEPDAAHDLIEHVAGFDRLLPESEQKLLALSPKELARALICGMRSDDEEFGPDHIFDLPSVPNLLFARDPQFTVGDSIVFSALKRDSRKRESLLSSFIFRHHPKFKGTKILMDVSRQSLARASNIFGSGTIEGGDVLIVSKDIVLVGISERTSEYGVELLAKALAKQGQFKTLIMVPMPANRAQMHLDTIFTMLGPDECLIYSPMIAAGSAQTLSALTIQLTDKTDFGRRKGTVLAALKDEGIDLKPIYCGGRDDFIVQSREQWTDGANAFAVRPNIITMYDRNTVTIDELDRNGYQIVSPENITIEPSGNLSFELNDQKKYAFLIPSNELSRARGGPRCMTMPLVRGMT